MPRRRLLSGVLAATFATALALPALASAAAAPYALTFGVAALRGTAQADVSLVQAATGEAPSSELYGGHGTVVLGLRRGTLPTSPAGRLTWQPGSGGTIAVPAMLRFAWNELAGPADAARPKKRCQGATSTAGPRRLVHALKVEREGVSVRVRWAMPLPRLGRFGCAGSGTLPRALAENVYPADVFDHDQVRLTVSGSQRSREGLAGGRTRSTVMTWDFVLTLVRLSG